MRSKSVGPLLAVLFPVNVLPYAGTRGCGGLLASGISGKPQHYTRQQPPRSRRGLLASGIAVWTWREA